MTDLKICRICLIQDVKMYKYVKEYYYEIISSTVNDVDGVPQWFCFECATILQKFYKFKQKCYKGLLILKELLEKGPISKDIVYQIDRKVRNLDSPLQVTSNTNVRVKTFLFRYRKATQIDSQNLCNNIEKSNGEEICMNRRFAELSTICIDKRNKSMDIEKIFTDEIHKHIINFSDDEISVLENYSNVDKTKKSYLSYKTEYNIISFEKRNHKFNPDSMETTQKDKNMEANKFKRSIKKKFLNPIHWKKFSLTDEDAKREFKAKEVNYRFLKAKYKCFSCFRAFSQEEMLNRHMKIKHCKSLGPFECRFCHMRVKWKSRLQKHLKEHYTRYKCLRCELTFSVEETAFKHDEFHNGVIRTCSHCGEKFKHSSSYYTHLRKHRSKHVCTICGISFLSEFGLYMHKKVKHILTNIEASKTEANMFCEVCNIKFETIVAYEEHLAQSAMHTHVTNEEDCTPQPLKCRYTQRRVPRKYTKCPTCDRNFSTYVAFSKHHLVEHPNVQLVPSAREPNVRNICEICGVSVAPVSLASHINTHTREKRHACNICGTLLSSKSGLNRHRLKHTGEKSNKCSLCDKSFARTTNMKLHHRTVHAKEPDLKK